MKQCPKSAFLLAQLSTPAFIVDKVVAYHKFKANLIFPPVVNGDVDSDHLHTRAVQTMVSMRGGLEAMSLTQAPLAMMLSM